MENKSSGGVSIVGVLTVVFVVLKLCKQIDWSWWWVLSPLWIVVALAVLMVIAAYIVKGYYTWKLKRKRKRK